MLTNQYHLINNSRKRMLDHLSTLPNAAYIQESDSFPKKSIRNLLVHAANVYLFWLEGYLKNQPVTFFQPGEVATVDRLRAVFETVDSHVAAFIKQYSDQHGKSISNPVPGYDFSVQTTPLALFTHVFTHEFHHKGQVMTRSRKLGYPPPDTDIVHFEAFKS